MPNYDWPIHDRVICEVYAVYLVDRIIQIDFIIAISIHKMMPSIRL